VIVGQPQTLFLGSLFPSGSGLFNLRAHAVASHPQVNNCMLALEPFGKGFSANGTVTVGNPNCGIAVDSASNPATDFKGGSGTVNGPFSVSGTLNGAGNNFTFTTPPQQNASNAPDPYIADGQKAWLTSPAVAAQAPTGCGGKKPSAGNFSSGSKSGGATYCNLSGGTLSDGVYYVNQITGPVTINNATVVVFSNSTINGNGTLKITAPNIVGAPNRGLGLVSPNAISISLGGTVHLNLQGAIYLPNIGSSFSENGDISAPCGQIIAGSISLSGNVNLNNNESCGIQDILTPGSIALVE
jgi:hypothetical protein